MVPRTKKFVVCEVECEDNVKQMVCCSSWIIRSQDRLDDNIYCLLPKKKESVPILADSKCLPGRDWTYYKCKILDDCSMCLSLTDVPLFRIKF